MRAPIQAEIIRLAKEVEDAMNRMPVGALHANRERAIRRNLLAITGGAVGSKKKKKALGLSRMQGKTLAETVKISRKG